MDSKDLIMIFKSRKNDERRTEENEAFLKLVIHSSRLLCLIACHFGLSEFALHLLNCVCID